MANGKTSRLKIFQAQFGFYDSVVAATSQPAALRAWGTHQNLFADGQAKETTDEKARTAALAHPNVPLRRALGSAGTFELEPTSRPAIPDLPKPAKRPAAKPQPTERPKPKPDRSKLQAAEHAVAALDARRNQEDSDFVKRKADLEAEISDARRLYQKHRKTLAAAVMSARRAYRQAGGED